MAAPKQDKRVDALKRARAAQLNKLIREVDPNGTLAVADPDELARRVTELRSARYSEMARASHAARRRNRLQREALTMAIRREALAAAEQAAAAVINAYAKAGVA
ncbi:hypothetical protein [Micromonospora sp. NPDC049204]|uniref:hypothetical protein n=1 Tax=Micromonospora sp. NPDC049204 TaxID=3154351 RepID=UPI0033E63630